VGLISKYRWPIAWAAAIFTSSCTVVSSKSFVQTVSSHSPIRVSQGQFDSFWDRWWWLFVKGWHSVEFGTLFLLIYLANQRKVGWALLVACSYGALDEFHQSFVPDRGARITDVMIDWLGIGIVLIVILSLEYRRKRRNEPI
jgi:VanZ family protein